MRVRDCVQHGDWGWSYLLIIQGRGGIEFFRVRLKLGYKPQLKPHPTVKQQTLSAVSSPVPATPCHFNPFHYIR